MSSSRARTHTFNNWISPLPSSYLKLSVRELTWGLLRIWTFAFLATFITFGMTFLMTVLWVLRLFHLFHIRPFLLSLLVFIWLISLIRSVFLRVIGLIITIHKEILLFERNLDYKFEFKNKWSYIICCIKRDFSDL